MAHDGAHEAPNVYDAEPIPAAARAEIERLLNSGDLFRYTNEGAPVALLEAEFAALLGRHGFGGQGGHVHGLVLQACRRRIMARRLWRAR